MPHRVVSLVAMAIVFAGASTASAQLPRIWSTAGITGIVDEADLDMHSFNNTGSVSIRSSVASGTLDIRYPVQTVEDLLVPQQGDCPEMRVVLRDTGAGARVIIRLMRLGVALGEEGKLTTLGVIDSNTLPPIADATRYRSHRACLSAPADSEFLFDFSFYAYYMDVQLIKTAATANPGLMSMQICPSQDGCDP